MKNLSLPEIDRYRLLNDSVIEIYGWVGDGTGGMFEVPSPIDHKPLRVVASSTDGWDHISVSREKRTPNWGEMEAIKRLFFKDDETAMQLHVPIDKHINLHPYTLHLWRPARAAIPMPPLEFV